MFACASLSKAHLIERRKGNRHALHVSSVSVLEANLSAPSSHQEVGNCSVEGTDYSGAAAQGVFDVSHRGVGPRALSNGINSAVFFCFFEALRSTFKQRKALVRIPSAMCQGQVSAVSLRADIEVY